MQTRLVNVTSRDLIGLLITNQHPNIALFFVKRCFESSQNAELKTLCNNIEGSPRRHSHQEYFYEMRMLCVQEKYEFDDNIFMVPMEVNGKNTMEPEHKDEFEENYMTEQVKTISGKTIRIKCDKKQKAETVSTKNRNEISDPSRNNLPHTTRKNAEEEEDSRGKQQ